MLAHVSNTFTVMNITTEASFLIILSSLSQQTSMNHWREEVRKKYLTVHFSYLFDFTNTCTEKLSCKSFSISFTVLCPKCNYILSTVNNIMYTISFPLDTANWLHLRHYSQYHWQNVEFNCTCLIIQVWINSHLLNYKILNSFALA